MNKHYANLTWNNKKDLYVERFYKHTNPKSSIEIYKCGMEENFGDFCLLFNFHMLKPKTFLLCWLFLRKEFYGV